MKKDFSLYLVTDEIACQGRNFLEVIEEAIQGGVTMVQLREKELSNRDFINRAVALKKLLRKYLVPLIINDRVDIALAVDADGVHIGQSDMPFAMLKKLLPPNKIIGISVENQADVIEAEQFAVDYIALSPLFNTATKQDLKEPWGIDGLRWVREHSRHPLVVIGGITLQNAHLALENGAQGIAVISAICSAASPKKAAVELSQIIKQKIIA